jgi:glycosyltransferase involved in cell wall biosynthesis
VADQRLPSFDLVVATIDRVDELGRLLASLEDQTHRSFRVLLVDQNSDDRIESVVRAHPSLEVTRFQAQRGLSRARNAALGSVRGDLVAFPDDDCTLPRDLLETVARRFATDAGLAGLTGRAVDAEGHSGTSWAADAAELTRENLWNRAISFTIFLRASVAAAVGEFDERLGLGSSDPWYSSEEIDYLIRAVDAGARVEYDPTVVVVHEDRKLSPSALRSIGARDGASVGYILRKHGYPIRTVGSMLLRPAGGTLLALARRDRAQAGFHLSTLRGRLFGYRAG